MAMNRVPAAHLYSYTAFTSNALHRSVTPPLRGDRKINAQSCSASCALEASGSFERCVSYRVTLPGVGAFQHLQ